MNLRIVLEPSDEGGYTAYVPALPAKRFLGVDYKLVDLDGASRRLLQEVQTAQERALPAARGPDDDDYFARHHVEVHSPDDV